MCRDRAERDLDGDLDRRFLRLSLDLDLLLLLLLLLLRFRGLDGFFSAASCGCGVILVWNNVSATALVFASSSSCCCSF